MRPIRFYRAKVKLARIWPYLPAGIVLLVAGSFSFFYAELNITPKSVSVSSYHRSDGAYVSSYNRRPPGSIAHDQPYEALQVLGFLMAAGGGVLTYTSVRRLFFIPPHKLLPPLSDDNLPQAPQEVRFPKSRAVARKRWSCERCRSGSGRGTEYWYFESRGRYTVRHKFCGPCRTKLSHEASLQAAKWREYSAALQTYHSRKERRLREQFRAYYGCDQ